jgi:hypothetical protein
VAYNHSWLLLVLITVAVNFEMSNSFAGLMVRYFYPGLGPNTDFCRAEVSVHFLTIFEDFDPF